VIICHAEQEVHCLTVLETMQGHLDSYFQIEGLSLNEERNTMTNYYGIMSECAYVYSRLDYDRRASHSYNFTIIASDNGTPSHRGSANVRVSVTNVNDEDPVFIQPVEHVLVNIYQFNTVSRSNQYQVKVIHMSR